MELDGPHSASLPTPAGNQRLVMHQPICVRAAALASDGSCLFSGREWQLDSRSPGKHHLSPRPHELSPDLVGTFPLAHMPQPVTQRAAHFRTVGAEVHSVPRVRLSVRPPHSSGAGPVEHSREVLCGRRGKPSPGLPTAAFSLHPGGRGRPESFWRRRGGGESTKVITVVPEPPTSS